MPEQTLTAWLTLYAATGLLAILCAVLATATTSWEYLSGRRTLSFSTWTDRVTALPRLWLRWQLNYLTGTPAIAAISLYFAGYIGFDTLGNV